MKAALIVAAVIAVLAYVLYRALRTVVEQRRRIRELVADQASTAAALERAKGYLAESERKRKELQGEEAKIHSLPDSGLLADANRLFSVPDSAARGEAAGAPGAADTRGAADAAGEVQGRRGPDR